MYDRCGGPNTGQSREIPTLWTFSPSYICRPGQMKHLVLIYAEWFAPVLVRTTKKTTHTSSAYMMVIYIYVAFSRFVFNLFAHNKYLSVSGWVECHFGEGRADGLMLGNSSSTMLRAQRSDIPSTSFKCSQSCWPVKQYMANLSKVNEKSLGSKQ